MQKRKKIKLTEPEKQTLLEMYRNHNKSRMRERAQMVLLLNNGYTVNEICSIVYRSENTVITWLNAYKSKGFLGLYDEPIPGRPPRLDDDHQNEVAKWLDGSPRKEGYQQSNWTLKLLSHHILLEFRTPFCLSRTWSIVHELGFTLIRPRHKSVVPTEKQILQAFWQNIR